MVVPSAKEAVQKLQAAGHFVSIATGRAYYKADHFREANGFAHMVCNGGHGIVRSKKIGRWYMNMRKPCMTRRLP